MSIPTTLSKGTIEIINDVPPILKPGDNLGASEPISPFYIIWFDHQSSLRLWLCILTQQRFWTVCSTIRFAPHSISNGLKNLMAFTPTMEFEIKEATTIKKEFIKDPSKLAKKEAAKEESGVEAVGH